MHEAVARALAEARALGLLGPGPVDAHERSAQAFAAALGEIDGPALDLGSGGGVPGLLLAALYDDVPWVLLDVNRRRASFLQRSVVSCGFGPRVAVYHGPAEAAAYVPSHRARYAVVVARSFGPPARTAECSVGFLALGGRLAVAEPPPEGRVERWPAAGLARLGMAVDPVGGDIAVLRRVGEIPEWAPRPTKRQQSDPLW